MINAVPKPDIDDENAEVEALAEAVAVARADPRGVPHEEMRQWLLRAAAGDFETEPPEDRSR